MCHKGIGMHFLKEKWKWAIWQKKDITIFFDLDHNFDFITIHLHFVCFFWFLMVLLPVKGNITKPSVSFESSHSTMMAYDHPTGALIGEKCLYLGIELHLA